MMTWVVTGANPNELKLSHVEGRWVIQVTGPDHPQGLSFLLDPADADYVGKLLLWHAPHAGEETKTEPSEPSELPPAPLRGSRWRYDPEGTIWEVFRVIDSSNDPHWTGWVAYLRPVGDEPDSPFDMKMGPDSQVYWTPWGSSL